MNRSDQQIMLLTSRCFVMFLWSAVGVTTLDSKPPCVFQMGDGPSTKCDADIWQPTPSSSVANETVNKNQADERNASESSNCTFDPCVHLQDACFNRPDPKCECPGVTSSSRPPNSPLSVELTAVTHGVLLVKWCAPYSPVRKYLLVVRHRDLAQRNLSFGSTVRQVFISDLTAESTYRVCVQAVNRAGPSGPECASVRTGVNTEVYLYGLLTVCVALMVVVATLSFCLYKQCKKRPVENPHLTRLISIPNPAFFSP